MITLRAMLPSILPPQQARTSAYELYKRVSGLLRMTDTLKLWRIGVVFLVEAVSCS